MLTNAASFRSYLPTVLTLLGSRFVLQSAGNHLSARKDIQGMLSGDKLFGSLFRKSMELDYEMLLDKTLLEKRQMAMKVFEGGTFNGLTCHFRNVVYRCFIIGGIIYVFAQIELWILLAVVGTVIINSIITTKRAQISRDTWEKQAPLNRKTEYFHTIDADTAFGKEIRMHNMRKTLFRFYEVLQKARQNLLIKNNVFYALCKQVQIITDLVLDILIYGFLGFKVLVQRLVTVGDFSLYINAITTLKDSIWDIVNSYILISDNGLYLKDYFDYMELKSRYEKTGRSLPAIEREAVFAFENVSFCYPHQGEPALKNISLTIGNKERLAIVGENGAGKTTLIKLLMRLFEPTEGRILLNGVDIKEINYDLYLSLFASVFQDFRLFAFRITDNITSLQDSTSDGDRPVDPRKLGNALTRRGCWKRLKTWTKDWIPISTSSTRKTG
jgi:ABC-type multidrug transport system fused ATPase/permease subunit